MTSCSQLFEGDGSAQARVAVLDDDAAVWPAEIWLNGFTYDLIHHRAEQVSVAERID